MFFCKIKLKKQSISFWAVMYDYYSLNITKVSFEVTRFTYRMLKPPQAESSRVLCVNCKEVHNVLFSFTHVHSLILIWHQSKSAWFYRNEKRNFISFLFSLIVTVKPHKPSTTSFSCHSDQKPWSFITSDGTNWWWKFEIMFVLTWWPHSLVELSEIILEPRWLSNSFSKNKC